MSQNGVLRIGHIETCVDQLVEQIFGESLVNREVVTLAGEFRSRPFTGEDGKSWNRSQEKSLHVIVADHERHVGLGLIQVLAKQAHGGYVGIELRGVFARRPHEKLRRMNRPHSCHNFSHDGYLVSVKSDSTSILHPCGECLVPGESCRRNRSRFGGKPNGSPGPSRTEIISQRKQPCDFPECLRLRQVKQVESALAVERSMAYTSLV